jgi:hypothetical protein
MKTNIKSIINFIGESVRFDDFGGAYLWGKQKLNREKLFCISTNRLKSRLSILSEIKDLR